MIKPKLCALFFGALLFSTITAAQNKVVVIPLGGDEPTKTELVFSRISTQCESGEHAFLDELGDDVTSQNPDFYLDDSDRANPFIAAVNSGPTLPDTTSRVAIFVRATPNGGIETLDAEIKVSDSSGTTSLVTDLNDCSSPTESAPFATGNIATSSQPIVSITGQTWLITSNLNIKSGVMTMGPTLIRLAQQKQLADKGNKLTHALR